MGPAMGMITVAKGSGRASATRSGRTRTTTTARSTRCSNPQPKACGRCGSRSPDWPRPRWPKRSWWPVRLGRAARRHAAQRGRRADRGAPGHRVPARPAAAHPPLHLRLRPGRGPGRHRHRGLTCCPRPRPRTPPSPGCCTRTPSPTWSAVAIAAALSASPATNWSPATGSDRPPDRVGRAGRRRPARPDRRIHLTGRAAGAGGVAIGWSWADPVVGLLITAAILTVGWQAAREVGQRLMDSVDPELTEQAEATLLATPGVLAAGGSGSAGSAVPCAPSARSRWTRRARSSRPTTSRSAPSTRSSTPSAGSPRPTCTPTPWRGRHRPPRAAGRPPRGLDDHPGLKRPRRGGGSRPAGCPSGWRKPGPPRPPRRG